MGVKAERVFVQKNENQAAILIMATVKHCLLSPLSKPAGFEAKMNRNIDFCALLAPAMAGKTFVAFDQPT